MAVTQGGAIEDDTGGRCRDTLDPAPSHTAREAGAAATGSRDPSQSLEDFEVTSGRPAGKAGEAAPSADNLAMAYGEGASGAGDRRSATNEAGKVFVPDLELTESRVRQVGKYFGGVGEGMRYAGIQEVRPAFAEPTE